MDISSQVLEKIKQYHPKGGLDHTAKLVLALTGIKHQLVKEHIERVALLAEAVAIELKKDVRATFFAGLLHDIGKLILPYYLFDGRDISQEEYEEVKQHALAGFESLAVFTTSSRSAPACIIIFINEVMVSRLRILMTIGRRQLSRRCWKFQPSFQSAILSMLYSSTDKNQRWIRAKRGQSPRQTFGEISRRPTDNHNCASRQSTSKTLKKISSRG
jgi:putative nucleotidyltransferase with HDIG domain